MGASWVRILLVARSFNCCLSRPTRKAQLRIGPRWRRVLNDEGGVVPGGRERNCTWLMDRDLGNSAADIYVGWKVPRTMAEPSKLMDAAATPGRLFHRPSARQDGAVADFPSSRSRIPGGHLVGDEKSLASTAAS